MEKDKLIESLRSENAALSEALRVAEDEIIKAPHDGLCDGTMCGKDACDCEGCWKVTALSRIRSGKLDERARAMAEVCKAAKRFRELEGGA